MKVREVEERGRVRLGEMGERDSMRDQLRGWQRWVRETG